MILYSDLTLLIYLLYNKLGLTKNFLRVFSIMVIFWVAFSVHMGCQQLIYNKPELLEGMAYVPAGLLEDQIEFRPTVELWATNRPKWMSKASSIIESFNDNGTLERLQELLENLDQRT